MASSIEAERSTGGSLCVTTMRTRRATVERAQVLREGKVGNQKAQIEAKPNKSVAEMVC